MTIKTYQDLAAIGNDEAKRMDFIRDCVSDYQDCETYKIAKDAEEYYAKRNVTMAKYVKVIRNSLGQLIPDVWGSNYKLTHNFFRRFVLQQAQYVLANGVTFAKGETKKKLGTKKKDFDHQISELAKSALVAGISFGYWAYDHLEVFHMVPTSAHPAGFAPIFDRDAGTLRAGVRYWECADGTLRWTLYEEDGYTEYIQKPTHKPKVLKSKRKYIGSTIKRDLLPDEELEGENYSAFPIIAMYGNDLKRSELDGHRPSIDCYDFIKSGMANNVDETSAFYWTLENAGGMDDVDLVQFVNKMKQLHAVALNGETTAKAETISVPVEANEYLLKILKNDLYDDFMMMNAAEALSGDKTATAIRLAYGPQDNKCGDFEYFVRDFIGSLLDLLGIDDEPSFKWDKVTNQYEETQMIMTAAPALDEETLVEKLPFLTPEEVELVKKRKADEEMSRITTEMPENVIVGET